MKKLYFFFALLTLPFLGFSQALNGSYVIKASNTDTNFKSLANAVALVNSVGVSGPVTFLLDEDATVSTQITINQFSGTSPANTLTIKPNTGKTINIYGGAVWSNTALIKLNNADNIIIDGSNTTNGTDRSLTLQSNVDTNYNTESIIWVGSSADGGSRNNVFKNIRFTGSSNGSNTTVKNGIIFSSATDVNNEESIASTNNTISNNEFYRIRYAVNVVGNSSSYAQNVKVANNIFGSASKEITTVSIRIVNGKTFSITDNLINTMTRTDNAFTISGISIEGKASTGSIARNTIKNISNTNGGGGPVRGILLDVSNDNTANVTILNNMISNLATNTNGMWDSGNGAQGIYINSGKGINIYQNTVVMNVAQNTTSAALMIMGGSQFNIRNNIFANTQAVSTNSRRIFAIYCGTTAASSTANYNDYVSSQYIGYYGNDRTTLADWKSATSVDANSKNVTPVFVSATDFHLKNPNPTNAALIGDTTLKSTYPTDIDGDTRNIPSMGADEYTPCVPAGNQTAYGNDSWIGYVYSDYSNADAAPVAGASTYSGYITETTLFDRNTGADPLDATTLCTPQSDYFFIRYKMNKNFTAGTYKITVGGDDGYRLSINGGQTWIVNNWSEHSYTSTTVSVALNGSTNLVLEYFEREGSSRVSFSYGMVTGDPTVFGNNVWNVYAYDTANFNLTTANYNGYFVDGALGINSEDRWNKAGTPSSATGYQGAPVSVDNFTLVHKRQGFPCGRYEVKMENWDDAAQVYIDGVMVWSADNYSGGYAVPLSLGIYSLGATTKMEVRLKENGGDARIKMSLTDIPVVYNGSWSSSDTQNSSIRIDSDLTVTGTLNVCSCTISAGKKLTINENAVLNVMENVTVIDNGKILIKNNGSLVQVKDYGTFTGNSTSFAMERNTTPVRRTDFTYWSSPVAAEDWKLNQLSPLTMVSKFFSFSPITNAWVTIYAGNAPMETGKGYIIRAPQTSDLTTAAVVNGQFVGKANTGLKTITVNKGLTKSNLIGNPYPSAINIDKLYNANQGVIEGTFYFWTHNTAPNSTSGTYSYDSSDYASYNQTGGTATAPADTHGNKNTPRGIIASGQGFFVNAIQPTATLVFTNNMRQGIAANNTQFYRTASDSLTQATDSTSIQKSRFWLNISNSTGDYNETLVGYVTNATDGIDAAYDGSSLSSGNTQLYSVIDGQNLVIQGRALPFTQNDVVPMGIKISAAGPYRIAMDQFDGLFQQQNIYLVDKLNHVTHDLKSGAYDFTSEAGTFNDRFEVQYVNGTLGVDVPVLTDNTVKIYRTGKQITVKTPALNMKNVTVYDLTGKQIFSKNNINNSEFVTSEINAGHQVILVTVTLDTNQSITKKIMMN